MVNRLITTMVLLVLVSSTYGLAEQEPLSSPLPASVQLPGAFDEKAAQERWERLRVMYFGERSLIEDEQSVVQLSAPFRTENDAFVPVTIHTTSPPSGAAIEQVYLLVDVNPLPLAGRFELSTERPLEEISTQVRVNGYTYVRASVETSAGELYMAKQMVKSRGVACAAPPITSIEDAEKNLGKMRFKFLAGERPDESDSIQLMISHPNATGMQKDQISLLMIPEHYVKEVEVSFNGELILRAETTFSISENPSFRFTFDPDETGELTARIVDTKDNLYYMSSPVN